ncbi:hypothetical protein [Mycolicibacterium aubagnense]|uniref:Uncharacterized protein n=1 Tax=Mycolicibacterium aubagnense TaxID=319707 RepID=A0ABN5YKN8_9MYCO|nr:hypothetical protein [Mycolicibacterium aubagnense]TLH64423.1 hypothetical protein C1S80_12110 [Mycolicibacterium aubagnense]BBX82154.1 hypothetical protein MAUB_00270 [Mycolicibacterium aubagnense]
MADNLIDIAEALRMGLAQLGGFVRPVSGNVFMGSGGDVNPDALAMYLAGALGLTQERREVFGTCDCGNESDKSWCDDDCNRRTVDHLETRWAGKWERANA